MPAPTPAQLQELSDEIREQAAAEHEDFPQYDGMWNSADWRLVEIQRRITTKMGLAFEKKERALARERTTQEAEHDEGVTYLVAYSVRNTINTVIKASDAVWME